MGNCRRLYRVGSYVCNRKFQKLLVPTKLSELIRYLHVPDEPLRMRISMLQRGHSLARPSISIPPQPDIQMRSGWNAGNNSKGHPRDGSSPGGLALERHRSVCQGFWLRWAIDTRSEAGIFTPIGDPNPVWLQTHRQYENIVIIVPLLMG